MTPGELKFALCVEAALNRIPEPEYRQLVVEMLMVLSLVVEYHPEQTLGDTIDVDDLVWEGHNLYLKDQVGMNSITVDVFSVPDRFSRQGVEFQRVSCHSSHQIINFLFICRVM